MFKGSLRKVTCLGDKLASIAYKRPYFSRYRFTSTSVTQIAPADIIFKYAPCIKLLMLLLGDRVTRVPEGPLMKSFEMGNACARVKWLPGIVHKNLGSVKYLVQLDLSDRVFRTNQVRKRFLSHPMDIEEWVPLAVPPTPSSPDQFHSPQSDPSSHLSPSSPGKLDLGSPQMGSNQEGATSIAVRQGQREVGSPAWLIKDCQVHLEQLNWPLRSTAKYMTVK
jgi:hypothetical protein